MNKKNKLKNRKGIEMPISTVAIFIFVLAVLSLFFVYFLTGARIGGRGFREIFTGPVEEREVHEIREDIIGAPLGGKCSGTPTAVCGDFYQTTGGLSPGGGKYQVSSCSIVGCYPIDDWGRIEAYFWRDDNLNRVGPECCDDPDNNFYCSIYDNSPAAQCIDVYYNDQAPINCHANPGYTEWRSADFTGNGRCAGCRTVCGIECAHPIYGASVEATCSDFTERGMDFCKSLGCIWTQYHVD